MKNKRWIKWLAAALALGVAWAGYLAVRAHAKLVTLKVRNAEVRKVMRSIAWQTWESVLVHKGVQGLVTLDVKDMPLAEVLDMVAQQTRSRCLVLYPLYSARGSLRHFKQVVAGELEANKSGWSNLVQVIFPSTPPMPQKRGVIHEEPITLQLMNRSLHVATLAFARFGSLRVVPEDGTPNLVTLSLRDAPVGRAVKLLAQNVRRKSSSYFSLLPGLGVGPEQDGPPGPDQMSGPPGGPPGAPPGAPPGRPPPSGLGALLANILGGPPAPSPPSREIQEQMERDYHDLMAVLPTQKAAQLQAERQFQSSFQNMSPGERQQAMKTQQQQFESQSGSLLESRREGLRTTTVKDRVERDRQEAARKRP